MLKNITDVTSVDLTLWNIDFMISCRNVEVNYRCLKLTGFLLKCHHPLTQQHMSLTPNCFWDFKFKNPGNYLSLVSVDFTTLSWHWGKLVELDPGRFYNFKLKIKDVESCPINSWPWSELNFMISSWNAKKD